MVGLDRGPDTVPAVRRCRVGWRSAEWEDGTVAHHFVVTAIREAIGDGFAQSGHLAVKADSVTTPPSGPSPPATTPPKVPPARSAAPTATTLWIDAVGRDVQER
jgi:hypothetical protein